MPERAPVAQRGEGEASSERRSKREQGRERSRWFIVWVAVLLAGFGPSLWELARFAWGSDLYSYILLVPFISLYAAWTKRHSAEVSSPPKRWLTLLLLVASTGVIGGYSWLRRGGWQPTVEDRLAINSLTFVCLLAAGRLFFLRPEVWHRTAFATGFLVFIVPYPDFLRRFVEGFLQHRSADAAQALFTLAGMPLVRHETVFQLPGFTLEVAPECSGIHSTLVLFVTSVVAGYLMLRSPWRRILLSASVIPLALLRNGVRIVTIGELCVNVSPDMINSYIHRKGGPIFFVLSLIPFFLLLVSLRKGEKKEMKSEE